MRFAVGLVLISAACAAGGLRPTGLRTEYQTNPIALDVTAPRFSWTLEATERAVRQTAYQVLVASSDALLARNQGNVWNSGKAGSDENFHIVFAGKPLESGRLYHWKVRVWDRAGRASAWSPAARFGMGLLRREEWQGQWIGTREELSSPLLRKEFALQGKVRRAIAHVAAAGWYELHFNGSKAGDLVLAPVNSNYDRVLYYDTYDVTSLLMEGANAAVLWLGNGYDANYSRWGYRRTGPKRVLLQLNIEYTDGRTQSVVTDGGWRAAASPITDNDLYNGEHYDARREQSGSGAGSHWLPAAVHPAPTGRLRSRLMPPIRAGQPIRPKSVAQPQPGRYVFDLGQNIAGWVRFRVKGPAGTTITVRHAEERHPDGTLDTTTNRLAKATDTYTLAGHGTERYEPRFTYHGFRYVEVSGWPGTPGLNDVEGIPVHADVESTGTFTSSHPLLNRIHSNFRWSILNNLMGIPTDTATRDERTPCQMDSVVVEDAAIHNFDMNQYYTKWLEDITGERSIPVWSGDQVFLAMRLYEYYGDRRILEQHYPNMKALVDHFTATAKESKHWATGYGDWCPPGPGGFKNCFSEGDLVDTAMYYQCARHVAECARLLGHSEDAARFTALAGSIRAAFDQRHFHAETSTYSSGRQVTSVMPLAFSMVPADKHRDVAEALAARVSRHDSEHLDTGIFGTRYLFDVLMDAGYTDLAFRTLTQTTAPGYGHQISLGATTTWEQWAYRVPMETHDHAMFSGPGSTLYTRLAGIEPAAPGYKRILIRPRIPAGLTHVSATLQTMMGEVASEWDTTYGYTHKVRIPANATALIYVPAPDAAHVTADGARYVRMEDGCAVFEAGSGNYVFTVKPAA